MHKPVSINEALSYLYKRRKISELAGTWKMNDKEAEFIVKNEIDKNLATTYINLFELYYGAYKSKEKENNIKAVSILLSRINVLNFSIESAKKAGEILAKLEKEGKPIKFRFQQNRRIKYCRLACLSFLHNLPVSNQPEPVAYPSGDSDSGADIRAYGQFQLAPNLVFS